MTLARSSVLFYNDFSTGPEADVGGPMSFSRDSEKWTLGRDGIYHRARAGQVAYGWADVSGKAPQPPTRRPLLRVDPGITPIISDSVDLSGDKWSQNHVSAANPVPPLFPGVSGADSREYIWDGVQAFAEAAKQFTATGSNVVTSCILEHTSADQSWGGIYSNTGSVWVTRWEYVWSTDTLTLGAGTGAVGREVLAEVGPNGGRLVRFWAVGSDTSGNTDRIIIQPVRSGTNSGPGDGNIIHYGNVEPGGVATAPIPYQGSAQTRTADEIYFENPAPLPQDLVAYVSVVGLDPRTNYARFWALGSSGAARLILENTFTDGALTAYAQDDSGNSGGASVNIGPYVEGDYIEAAVVYTQSTGRLRIVARRNDGGAFASETTPASWTPPTDWNVNRLTVGSAGGGTGAHQTAEYGRIYFAKPSDLASAPYGDTDALLDELRDFHLPVTG